ncbi:MAG TPA: hypothetical protein VN041_02110 [Microbacterium sp.]|nr:hypothetical protein [Microbacterium sp.]
MTPTLAGEARGIQGSQRGGTLTVAAVRLHRGSPERMPIPSA